MVQSSSRTSLANWKQRTKMGYYRDCNNDHETRLERTIGVKEHLREQNQGQDKCESK